MPLPHDRIGVDAAPAGEVDEVGDAGAAAASATGADRDALVHQRRDRDRPALVDVAEHVLVRHAHVVEEDLVERRRRRSSASAA